MKLLKLGLLSLTLVAHLVLAKDKPIGIGYLNQTFGLVHESASKYSASLTSIMCGFPLKIYAKENLRSNWVYVVAGDSKGYVQSDFVSKSQGYCLQERYSKFFQALNLTLTDFYYWGKLQDQYESFETTSR